ncbi:hypothetical protein, partial [Slackia sp.]|uniref:hypothetical protein n=1 Tax=Slackia sp. TaxID=2049041 RepID=UPI00257DB0AA
LCRSQSHPDVVQSVSSHKKASHFLCPRNGRQFKASLGVSLRDAVCGWKCAVEKRSGFRYNQINESA